jgi:Flp pilus assembly protein TadG
MMEMSLILLPLLALALATFDFAMAITLQNTMQYAVRQGVRYAITGQTSSGLNHDASIKAVVLTSSMGMIPLLIPANAVPADYISITYYDPNTFATLTGAGSNKGGNICQVSVSGLSYRWMATLMRGTGALAISASSSDIMEASPNGIPPTR